MPSLKALRNRRDSVMATRKITKAMQMVAAAKLRRAQEAATAARPYAERMERLLNRGARLTELLKQPQFSPLKVEEQVAVIFAGTRGYLDPIPVAAVGAFEQQLLRLLREEQAPLLRSIAVNKELTADTEKELVGVLDRFAKAFAA